MVQRSKMVKSSKENADHLVVAIDGPAGSGKSTVSRLVAQTIGAVFVDTGAIYRSLAFLADKRGVSWDDEPALAELAGQMRLEFHPDDAGGQRVWLDGEDVSESIRTPEISQGASKVSGHAAVRTALLSMQREFSRRASVVAEGRDTGTVVFPQAQVKVFLVADDQVRAERRQTELQARGLEVSLRDVLQQQQSRDEADSSRSVAPLRRAVDAVRIDTSRLTIAEVVRRVVALCADHHAMQEDAGR